MVVTNAEHNELSIQEFIRETKKDLSSPTTSTFTTKIGKLKHMTNAIEENLDVDKNGLSKMKKAVKAIYNGGCADCENKIYLSEALEKLGMNAASREAYADNGFLKFSLIVKDLVDLQRNLMQNISNNLLFPLESILKGDLKGVKNDLKKPFDKAWKEYDIKMSKIEKEKKAQAKEAGLIRTEISGAEIAEETDRERKQFQYHMLDFLIKVNEIETRKDIDLLLHFIDYFNVQSTHFKSALDTIDKFNSYIADLQSHLQTLKQNKEEEKKELIDLKNVLKTSCSLNDSSFWTNTSIANESTETKPKKAVGYSLHQLQGNTKFGSHKSGFLLKKSEGKMGVKVWQKRKCEVHDGLLHIWHADETKPPTKINLLTCQIKTLQGGENNNHGDRSSSIINTSKESNKNYDAYFDLISCNRTYHFQVEDPHEAGAWISVLLNSRQGALKKQFDNSPVAHSDSGIKHNHHASQSLKDMQRNLILQIKTLPGNDCCVDCNSTNDPTWLSVNFGVLTCIECSGIHRKMGVHISRIQSLTLDVLGTSQLLIARVMSNSGLNDIMEASCSATLKLKPGSTMLERNEFIRAKYMDKKFVIRSCASEHRLLYDLKHAIQSRDLHYVLQIWAELNNLALPLPEMANGECAAHYAIMHDDVHMLPIVEFIIENSCTSLNACTIPCGNTPLHYCCIYNRVECAKLLLRSGASVNIKNTDGKTPLDLAKEENNFELCELIERNDRTLFENVLFDLSMQPEDPSTDFSDDEFDEKNSLNPVKRVSSSRPSSVTGDVHLANIGISLKPVQADIEQSNYGEPRKANQQTSTPNLGRTLGGGHSRAASADISNYNQLDSFHGSNVQTSSTQNMPAASICDYSFPINNNPPNHSTPIKPVGISVFVPGSMSAANQNSSRLKVTNQTTADVLHRNELHPIPPQRKKLSSTFISQQPKPRRAMALYDCEADQDDELSFRVGEIIVVLNEQTNDDEWMEGMIEGDPARHGLVPKIFVNFI